MPQPLQLLIGFAIGAGTLVAIRTADVVLVNLIQVTSWI